MHGGVTDSSTSNSTAEIEPLVVQSRHGETNLAAGIGSDYSSGNIGIQELSRKFPGEASDLDLIEEGKGAKQRILFHSYACMSFSQQR